MQFHRNSINGLLFGGKNFLDFTFALEGSKETKMIQNSTQLMEIGMTM